MSVTYKKVFRPDPIKKDGTGKYYPQLIIWGKSVTLEQLAIQMQENSSLSLGDIKSVLTNFVSAMRTELYNGHSVNIDGFGVFSLSARTEGTELKEECTVSNIKAVRINFRASSAIRPNLDPATTRAEDRIDFVDLDSQLARLGLTVSEDASTDSGSGDNGSTEGDDENLYG
ncbi:MAG: HU family DNA-binding protein [Bacteroides sp.]|nr:HU family DNA-binding protein [Bacteroides sp.]